MTGISYKNRSDIQSLRVPFRFDPETENRGELHQMTGMWTLVDKTWTKTLADHIAGRHCLQVFAGRGWLAQALSDHGVQITATSRFSTNDGSNGGLVYDVMDISAREAVQRFDFEVLIFGWPPANEEAAEVLLEAVRMGRQFEIVFIGEPYSTNPAFLSGTASDRFFELTEVVKELRDYRNTRGKQGIDVCQIMRMKQQ